MRGWDRAFVLVWALAVTACTSTAAARSIGPLAPVFQDAPAPQQSRAAPEARAASAATFPYVVRADWKPTVTNYDEGRDGASVDYIVIHYTEISFERTLRAFNNPNSFVSAHYVVRNDGHVTQMVGEADTAWHSGDAWFNDHSVGIELERSDESNPEFTPQEYYAAAALSCQIAARHGIPLDRAHIVGHNEVPGSDHSDPGPTWGWDHFMYLTSLCAPPTAQSVRAQFVFESPYPTVQAGASATVSIVLRNAGVSAWRKGTPQEARLGIPGNDRKYGFLGLGWPSPERVAIQQEEVVPTGGTATFTFTVSAMIPGTYILPLRGVIDGGAWMNDLGLFTVITVR